MIRKHLLLAAFVAAAVAAAAVAAILIGTRQQVEPTLPGAALYRFDESSPETRRLMLSAVEGSADSAAQLMEKYTKCHKMAWPTEKERARCLDSLRFWTSIALENGSAQAAALQTASLLGSKKCVDAYRAEFWYNRFREAFREHQVYLKSLAEEIADNQKSCTW